MTGSASQDAGLVSVRSHRPLPETIKNLMIAIERRGMMIFARINHAKAAKEAGLKLLPAELFVFGYPEAEAPLIAKTPLLAVDFPQRLLVSEDANGAVLITYNDPVWLGRRHGVEANVYPKLAAIATSLAGIAIEAGGGASDLPGA